MLLWLGLTACDRSADIPAKFCTEFASAGALSLTADEGVLDVINGTSYMKSSACICDTMSRHASLVGPGRIIFAAVPRTVLYLL